MKLRAHYKQISIAIKDSVIRVYALTRAPVLNNLVREIKERKQIVPLHYMLVKRQCMLLAITSQGFPETSDINFIYRTCKAGSPQKEAESRRHRTAYAACSISYP